MKLINMLKTKPKTLTEGPKSIYDLKLRSLNGTELDWTNWKGKYLLFVNVASKCGFTPQYKELQKLSDTYKDQLVVIGCPCNQFGGQEPGGAEEIQGFCELNYGITFPLTEKLAVKGSQQHPLYQWLTSKEWNGKKSSTVRWNFEKYLVGPKGQLIDHYLSVTKPMSKKITKHLN